MLTRVSSLHLLLLLLLASVPVDAVPVPGATIPDKTNKNIDKLAQAMKEVSALRKSQEKLQKSIDQRQLRLMVIESERQVQAKEIRHEKRQKREVQSTLDEKKNHLKELYEMVENDKDRMRKPDVARAIHKQQVKIAKKDPLIPKSMQLGLTDLKLSEDGSSHGHRRRRRSHGEHHESSGSRQASSRHSRGD